MTGDPRYSVKALKAEVELARGITEGLPASSGAVPGFAAQALAALDSLRVLLIDNPRLSDDQAAFVGQYVDDTLRALHEMREELVTSRGDAESLMSYAVNAKNLILRALDNATLTAAFPKGLPDRTKVIENVNELDRRLDLRRRIEVSLGDAELAARKAEQAEAAARKAAGQSADTTMETLWRTYGRAQQRSAIAWRVVGLFVIGLTAVVNVALGAPDSTATAIQHTGLTVVAVAAAGYLLAEASRHRRVAHWALVLEVQFRTLDAFCESLEDAEARRRLRETFGQRVFGDPPADSDGESATPTAQLIETLNSVLERRSVAS